ncbi:hypothetical protein N825_31535 [Skermanella stibiiresistens SB22]|uniref:Uncharacterized protein n=1 Tax=Skermanella stibiiresistens SB22 TaxID=1385369 RepID=W9HBF4_9PROT|nr:hypothetical protein [Skermanella stibiiresistens]EWY41188.1 hypothetical protein N825_31535 [Skermanella stibiiresistens SB22]
MSLIHNERVKLIANALDRASTACVTVGVFGPAVGFPFGTSPVSGSRLALAFGSVAWISAAEGLHLIARKTLGGMK